MAVNNLLALSHFLMSNIYACCTQSEESASALSAGPTQLRTRLLHALQEPTAGWAKVANLQPLFTIKQPTIARCSLQPPRSDDEHLV